MMLVVMIPVPEVAVEWIKELLLDFKTTKALNKQLRLRCAHAVCWIKLGYKMTHTQATHHYPCPQPITSPGSSPLVLSGGAQRVVSPRDVEMHASMRKYRFIKYIVLLAGVCAHVCAQKQLYNTISIDFAIISQDIGDPSIKAYSNGNITVPLGSHFTEEPLTLFYRKIDQ